MHLYLDDRFTNHDTGSHPECPDRIRRINDHLRKSGVAERCTRPLWKPASIDQVTRVHDADYLEHLEKIIASGGGRIESDTVTSEQSFSVALLAAGAAVSAVDCVLEDKDQHAACLVRPPGHHALHAAPMGFCLMNNVAVAATHAVFQHELERVMIVDFDVHHGNGTQDAFWTDPNVSFYSMHRWPFYPGSGTKAETGSGAGLGTTLNEPIEFGMSTNSIIEKFTSSLTSFAEKAKPQLMLVSAGFDAHRLDPIGSLNLETEHFGALTKVVVDIANSQCQGRVVSLLEGGYNLEVLPDCVETHLTTIQDGEAPRN